MKIYYICMVLCGVVLVACKTSHLPKDIPVIKQDFITSIVDFAATHYIFSDSIDWQSIETRLSSATTQQQEVVIAEHLLNSIGNKEASLFYKGEQIYPTPPSSIANLIYPSLYENPMTIQWKEDSIVYCKITDFAALGKASNILTQICAYQQLQPKGWIFDLQNSKNHDPLVVGKLLGALQPNAFLGGMSIDGKNYLTAITTREGILYKDTTAQNKTTLSCAIDKAPVILLISATTSQSGTTIAALLKGHKNITIIGQVTTTGLVKNEWYYPTTDIALSIPNSAILNTKGEWITNGLKPDILAISDVSYKLALEQIKKAY